MSNRVRCILFWFITAVCFSGMLTFAHADVNKPVAVVVADSYDFGEVFEGTDVTRDFIIKNTGNADLIIEKVKSG